MPPSRKMKTSGLVADNLVSIRERQHQGCKGLEAHCESTTEWLRGAIEACKRKVLNDSNREENGAKKKMKLDTGLPQNKENGNPNSQASENSSNELINSKKQPGKPIGAALELKVKTYRVAELRAELEARGLSTAGLKKDLRKRLLEALSEDDENDDPPLNCDTMECEKVTVGEQQSHSGKQAPVSTNVDQGKECAPKLKASTEGPAVITNGLMASNKETSEQNEHPKKETASVAATDGARFSPKNLVQAAGNLLSHQALRLATQSGLASAKKLNQASFTGLHGAPNNFAATTGPKTKTPGLASTSSSDASATSNGSALSSGVKAKTDARKARLAEIRGKSKPVLSSTKSVKAPKEMALALSSSKIKASSDDEKRKLRAAQMREKAAATAAMKKQADPAPNSKSPLQRAETRQNKVEAETEPLETKDVRPNENIMHDEPLQDPPSPMETYEISDKETDSEDSDSDEESEPKKKIPSWAMKANLIPALQRQFAGGHSQLDPDDIFGEVETCDLQAIFDSKKARYIRRTSSGNWTKDRVTAAEKLSYKRAMGYNQRP